MIRLRHRLPSTSSTMECCKLNKGIYWILSRRNSTRSNSLEAARKLERSGTNCTSFIGKTNDACLQSVLVCRRRATQPLSSLSNMHCLIRTNRADQSTCIVPLSKLFSTTRVSTSGDIRQYPKNQWNKTNNVRTNSSSTSNTATTPFLLADIGEGIAEVELMQWFVKPGDFVSQFDRVCEVQSDKATVEITSRFQGVVVSLGGNIGDMIQVGKPLLHLNVEGDKQKAQSTSSSGDASRQSTTNDIEPSVVAQGERINYDEDASGTEQTLHNTNDEADRLHIPLVASTFPREFAPQTAAKNTEQNPANSNESSDGEIDVVNNGGNDINKVYSSPAVRKMARENGIELSTVVGTGPSGRILKGDLIKMLGTGSSSGSKQNGRQLVSDSNASKPSLDSPNVNDRKSEMSKDAIIPIRGYNRLMLKTMTASLSVPHMCYGDEINITNLRALRHELDHHHPDLHQHQQQQQHSKPLHVVSKDCGIKDTKQGKLKLTYLPFAIKAASLALNQYPMLNSTLNAEEYTLTYHRDHNIGMAMDTPRGLAVCVLHQCQNLSLWEIAYKIDRLKLLARTGSLSEHDVTHATFSISNIGSIGGTYMNPVVVPPTVAIGAMGKVQRVPRFVSNDSMDVEEMFVMQISWGADHRVVDGATLARFSNVWKLYMEHPSSMMLSMR